MGAAAMSRAEIGFLMTLRFLLHSVLVLNGHVHVVFKTLDRDKKWGDMRSVTAGTCPGTTTPSLLGSPADAIVDFPAPAGVLVQSLTGQIIATDWASMVSSDLLYSFNAAGVI